MTSPYKIALIVLYFGSLPPYFPIWLKSAEANPDVDFLVWSDQDIETDAPNFRVTKTTLDELRRRFEKTLNRPLVIPNGYKLCDYRPAFGLLFEEELRGYDFWGHCDVDLVFGQIRHFLTDEILGAYDRFYAHGPLSLYRNSEKMRRAFELPGSWFTLDEMFGSIHIGADETAGINRICWKNRIAWHTGAADCAFLDSTLKARMEMRRGRNYSEQIFYYLDGRAFQRYMDGGQVKEREFAHIHWLKKRPVPERVPAPGEAVVIAHDKLLVRSPDALTPENMRLWNLPARKMERFLETNRQRAQHYLSFFTGGGWDFKKIWLKRRCFWILEYRIKKLPYLQADSRAGACVFRRNGVK
jgi:hypothetical protein